MQRTAIKITVKALTNWLATLLIIALLTACGEKPVYEEYVSIPAKGWYKDSLIHFEVEITDTATPYRVMWYLRNNNDYAFSNIYLFRKVTSERGVEFADTASFPLADPYGKWLGKGVGELKTNTWPFKNSLLYFNREGIYRFSLQQAMRTNHLEGVEDVGLGVFKATEKQDEQ
ncbi:MAG: gliding motility lipoprotein GldH [Owenweeksia sp.]|nr:gliding motility lipoprotein GldH [Owenweeksia sp.]